LFPEQSVSDRFGDGRLYYDVNSSKEHK